MAIVGRPNVGKSTLFNRIVGGQIAIVEDRARTTRDRLYSATEWNGRRFVVIDTGGLERRPGDPIEEKVQDQARLAIAEADVILFVVDAAAGLTPADDEAAELLRRATVPVIVVANKADNEKRELEAAEAFAMGWEDTYAVSAQHGRGTGDLLDAIVWALPAESESEIERKRREAEIEELAQLEAEGFAPLPFIVGETPEGDELDEGDPDADEVDPDPLAALRGSMARIAIVGRPNVGKSSLLNSLAGEERVIVSDIPGTTRDAIDTQLEWNGQPVKIVDTAGIRRRGRVASGPAAEKFSTLRSLRAIGRADVALLILDAVDGLTSQDAHVAGYVVDEGVGLVVVINKWDLVEKDDRTFDEYSARLRVQAPFLGFAPIIAVSAKTGQRVGKALDAAVDIARGRRRRIATGALNRVLNDATFRQPAPPVRNRRPKFYYATQASIEPPTFVLFASGSEHVHFSYKRYLENRLREAFGFGGTPLRIIVRERSRIELESRPRKRMSTRGTKVRVKGKGKAGGKPH